ncbi:MAG: hypothetical protein ACXW1W_09715, partial [Methylococcaceae bacterium]
NAFTISHGCASNVAPEGTGQLDVVSTSVVFPNGAGAIVNKIDAAGNAIEPIALDQVITGTVGGVFTNMGPSPVYPSTFGKMAVTFDELGNVRGFNSYGGNPLAGKSAIGLVPFRMSAVSFEPTSCAKALKIRIAVGNWCLRGHGNDANDARADLWIGHITPLLNDPEVMPYNATDTAAGKFYWPTLTVNRDLVLHPLDAACNGGFDVAIEPSDADIDTYLPFPSTTTGAIFWPASYK